MVARPKRGQTRLSPQSDPDVDRLRREVQDEFQHLSTEDDCCTAVRLESVRVGERSWVNLHAGDNVTITAVDVPQRDEVYVSISADAVAGAPVDAQYIVASANGTLTNERVLTAGTNVTIDNTTPGQTIVNATASGAPANASYVCIATNASLSAERVLTAGFGISLTDGGANGNATIASTLSIGDGGTDVDPCRTIEFDAADGFSVTDLGGGQGRVSLGPDIARVVDRQNTTIDIVSDDTAQTLYTYTVPANTLVAGSRLVIEIDWDALNNSGSTRTAAWVISFGGTTLHSVTLNSFPNNNTRRPGKARFSLHVRSASEVVYRGLIEHVSVTTTSVSAGYGASGSNKTYDMFSGADMFSVTLSNPLTFLWTSQWSLSSASLSIRKLAATATLT